MRNRGEVLRGATGGEGSTRGRKAVGLRENGLMRMKG